MGVYTHVPRYRNTLYRQRVRRSIYEATLTKRPHWPICRYERRPKGSVFVAPLHGIFSGHEPSLSMSMSTSTSMSVSTSIFMEYSPKSQLLLSLHRHAKSCQGSDATAIIGIGSFALTTVFASTRLDHFWPDSTYDFYSI